MTKPKEVKSKTQDILASLCITIIFITVISVIFIKMANITYEIERTAQETKQLIEKKEQIKQSENIENTTENNEQEKVKEEKNIQIEPDVTGEYIPIKFLWTGNDEGYWIKTNKEDKEWYSIEEGIYPTYVCNPEITEMTFRINGEYNDYEVITDWEGKIYIWLPKLENEEYDKLLFSKSEKGTLLLHDGTWENQFNQTYNGRNKIELLPTKIEERLINSYNIYIENMQNQNIQDEELEDEETDNDKKNENQE